MPENEDISALVIALVQLPDRERQVVTLRKVYEYTAAEIAIKLGITEAEVDAIYRAAVTKLWKAAE